MTLTLNWALWHSLVILLYLSSRLAFPSLNPSLIPPRSPNVSFHYLNNDLSLTEKREALSWVLLKLFKTETNTIQRQKTETQVPGDNQAKLHLGKENQAFMQLCLEITLFRT